MEQRIQHQGPQRTNVRVMPARGGMGAGAMFALIMGCVFICGIVPCCCFAVESQESLTPGVVVTAHEANPIVANENGQPGAPPGASYMKNGIWVDTNGNPVPQV